ncbi:MAG: hypothetical protein RLZ98_331 [Pseudomonadota bacterium]|jgi:hypothetical protein
MKTVKAIAAVAAAFVLSIGGASAAQHQDKSAPKLAVPAIVAPVGALASPAVADRIVVAQRRGGARRGGGVRRVAPVRRAAPVRRGGRVVRRGRGRGVAAGVAAGIIGLGVAAAIANSANAGYEGGGDRYCSRLRWRCDDGERWACRRFYREC